MHYTGYGKLSKQIPQNEPIPGTSQVANNAGGFSWAVDDMTRLQRFLILGTTGGTYYVGERKLTKENLDALERLLKAGRGAEVVQHIVAISDAGRAVSNDPALFALARCCAEPGETGRLAYDALQSVARTGTHLLHFVEYVKQFRGRGRRHRRAIRDWYQAKHADRLAFQVLKYQSRDGWSQRDILRLARPKPADSDHNAVYHWITKGWDATPSTVPSEDALKLIWAFEKAKHASDANEVADLILTYKLPREAVPTTALGNVKVWEALLQDMPLEAMTRNLATMTKNSVLVPMGEWTRKVTERLHDREVIRKARLHPIKLLAALTTYSSGKSVRGDATWTPLREIIDALSDAFYLSFANVEPTGKRILIAVDVSGSMHGTLVNGIPNLQCHTAAAAMAMVLARSEQRYHVMAFDTTPHTLTISPSQRLDDVTRAIASAGNGGTDCAVPFVYALQHGLDVDAFITISDSETWYGKAHPSQALTLYRQKAGHAVRAINVQMTATHVSNNDPNDRNAMECIGMDVNVPEIMSGFIRGDI